MEEIYATMQGRLILYTQSASTLPAVLLERTNQLSYIYPSHTTDCDPFATGVKNEVVAKWSWVVAGLLVTILVVRNLQLLH